MTLYNAEKYLRECIESILAQDYGNLEIVAVINGRSADATEDVVYEYAGKDERVKVVDNRKEKSTVGEGIEAGIKKMTGGYFTIIDGDDYLLPGALRGLRDSAKVHDADIVVGSIVRIRSDGVPYKNVGLPEFESLDRTAYLEKSLWFMDYLYHGKLYKSELLKRRDVVFLPVLLGADRLLHYQLVMYAHTISRYEDDVHCYRDNETSQSNNMSLEKFEESFSCYLVIDELFEKEGAYDDERIKHASKAQGLLLLAGCLLSGQNGFYRRYRSKAEELLHGETIGREDVVRYVKGWRFYYYVLRAYRHNPVLGAWFAFLLNAFRTSRLRSLYENYTGSGK